MEILPPRQSPEGGRIRFRLPSPGMCRYHLLPNAMGSRIGDTWGATGPRDKKGIRAQEVTLTVTEASPAHIRLTLEGFVHLGNAHDPKAGPPKSSKDYLNSVGYEARLRGNLTYDTGKQAFTCFDMVALGEMYGEALREQFLLSAWTKPGGLCL